MKPIFVETNNGKTIDRSSILQDIFKIYLHHLVYTDSRRVLDFCEGRLKMDNKSIYNVLYLYVHFSLLYYALCGILWLYCGNKMYVYLLMLCCCFLCY